MNEIPITERELPDVGGGRRIRLEACVNGEKIWRVWYEKFGPSLEEKRKTIRRDIDLVSKQLN